jgi:hypothetical protein
MIILGYGRLVGRPTTFGFMWMLLMLEVLVYVQSTATSLTELKKQIHLT